MIDLPSLQQLNASYAFAVDGTDAKAFVSLFHPHAVFEVDGSVRFTSHEEAHHFFALRPPTRARHHITNVCALPSSDGLFHAGAYVLLMHEGRPVGDGTYEDVVVPTGDGRLTFARRAVRFSHRTPLNP